MSFLNAQGSNCNFNNMTVNDLTINGKLLISNPEPDDFDIPADIICDTITSTDGTNELDMATANQINLKATNVSIHGDTSINGHNLSNVNQINGENGVLNVGSGSVLHIAGHSKDIQTMTSQGLYVNWNDTGFYGEVDFVCNKGLGNGGYNFYIQDTSGNTTDGNYLMSIDGVGALHLTNTDNSTSATTGAIQCAGGAGFEKNVYVGGVLTSNYINSIDGTNQLDMNTPSEIHLKSNKTAFYGDTDYKGNNLTNLNQIYALNDVLTLAGGSVLHIAGHSKDIQTMTTQGLYLNWNENSIGDVDFICNKGLGSGGFKFYVQDTSGNTTDGNYLMSIDGTGKLIMPNTTNATSATTGTIQCAGGVGIQKDVYIGGNLNVSGQIINTQTPTSEYHTAYIANNDDGANGTILITGNGTKNYAVFSSFYYGFSGSGGTYDAYNTSGAVHPVVISNIQTNSFDWVIQKSGTKNVNIYVNFQVVYSNSFNYAKEY